MSQVVEMLVTEVHLTWIKPRGGLIAMAKIVLNCSLVLDGIGIHRKLNGHGYRLTYPTRPISGDGNKTMFHPIRASLSKAIESAIFTEMSKTPKVVDQNDRHDSPDFG